MPVRLATAVFLAAAFVAGTAPDSESAERFLGGSLMISTAQAEPSVKSATEHFRSTVRTLIDRLRGRTLPEGIVKSNGRLEATQVDVAAKYPGRLATVTVDEGDEVTAGQTVATISAPEYEAQLRGAQAQVLRAKQALAEAVALIAQRNSDLSYAKTDYERGQTLLARGNIAQQAVDQRRNKFEAAEAAYRAATAQRDQAQFAIQAAQADVDRLESILVDLVLSRTSTGWSSRNCVGSAPTR